MILKQSEVKKIIRAHGKRCKPAALEALNRFVTEKVEAICKNHNGGAKTIDEFLVAHYFGKTSI